MYEGTNDTHLHYKVHSTEMQQGLKGITLGK